MSTSGATSFFSKRIVRAAQRCVSQALQLDTRMRALDGSIVGIAADGLVPRAAVQREMGCDSGMTCWRRLRDWQEVGAWGRILGFFKTISAGPDILTGRARRWAMRACVPCAVGRALARIRPTGQTRRKASLGVDHRGPLRRDSCPSV